MTESKPKALVVDDNENNLTLERDLLRVAGFEVFEAINASDGIRLAVLHMPDVVVMDVRLPDMRGSEAAIVLRGNPETKDIPIIFVTASVMADGRDEIKDIPNTGFIGKPINTRTFSKEIRDFMNSQKSVILVVDDQPANVDLLEARLVPQGFTVIKASSGEEALEKLSQGRIDVVLLDVMMPGMDGLEVTRRVRKDPTHRQLPIILVTALTETEDRVRGIDAGCDDFLSKPVDKQELLARVKSLLKVKAYNDLLATYQKQLETDVAKRTEELTFALEKVKAGALETIYRLTRAAEYKDEETGAHIKRMSHYSAAIATALGLDAHTVDAILHGAPMHDIGKLGIPDRILMKTGPLEPTEMAVMKLHTVVGSEILKGSPSDYIKMGELIARTHHERWDGSGYPAGLSGLDIPLESRIVAVADVFDALTANRPYRRAIPIEDALTVIREGRGTNFDPHVVDAFFAAFNKILAIKLKFEHEESLRVETAARRFDDSSAASPNEAMSQVVSADTEVTSL